MEREFVGVFKKRLWVSVLCKTDKMSRYYFRRFLFDPLIKGNFAFHLILTIFYFISFTMSADLLPGELMIELVLNAKARMSVWLYQEFQQSKTSSFEDGNRIHFRKVCSYITQDFGVFRSIQWKLKRSIPQKEFWIK